MWRRPLLGSASGDSSSSQRKRRSHRVDNFLLEALDPRIVPAFVGPTDYPVGTSTIAVVSADLTGDGKLDLAAVNGSGNTLSVLVGIGDGTFQPAVTTTVAVSIQSIEAGNLNGDGKADLLIRNYDNFAALLSNGDGTFQEPLIASLPAQVPPGYIGDPLPQAVLSAAVGDLNADGKLDVVVGGQTFFGDYYSGYYSDGYVNVLLGNGDGKFTPTSVTHVGYDPYTIVVDTFTSDANADVAINDYSTIQNLVRILPGNGDGTLGSPIDSPVTSYLVPGATGDFDNDGKRDLLAREYNGGLVVLKGDGQGKFTQLDPTPAPYGSVAVGDINSDGKLDLAVAWQSTVYGGYFYIGYNKYYTDPVTTGHVNVLLGYGDGTFAPLPTTDLSSHPGYGAANSAVLGKFDGDKYPELAALTGAETGYFDGSVVVAANDGNWTLPAAIKISDASVTEGDTGTVEMSFTVTLLHGGTDPVSVHFATNYGSASANDFQAGEGDVTFGIGETSKTVKILITGDRIDEPNQTFTVNLSGPTNAILLDGAGTGTIVDNDPAPTLSINDVSVIEGDKGSKVMVFTVSLLGATENWVSVNYATSAGSATANQDYLSGSSTVSFAPGQTTANITIQILGDKDKEGEETLFVNLSGAEYASIFDSIGIGTILDDDNKGSSGGGGNGGGKGKNK